jgi:transcriptional regulator with PAS, ATPase and Fis domain
LGSTKTRHVDVRIIAATSQNLPALIKSGQFRQDLYYRINVMTIELPSLRERKEDIPLLIAHYMQQLNQTMGKHIRSISADGMKLLLNHDYQGNIRELQNIIEHAFVLCKDHELITSCLPPKLSASNSVSSLLPEEPSSLQDLEKQTILETLKQHQWNKTKAANTLGIDRTTLWRKLKKYNLS